MPFGPGLSNSKRVSELRFNPVTVPFLGLEVYDGSRETRDLMGQRVLTEDLVKGTSIFHLPP